MLLAKIKAVNFRSVNYNRVLLILFLLVMGASRLSHALNAPGSAPYDYTSGELQGNKSNIKVTTIAQTEGAVDSAMVIVTKCDSSVHYDLANGRSTPCSPEVVANDNNSLLAMAANTTQGAVDTPPPANMALFIRDLKHDSLISNEAYAAESSGVFLSILGIWKGIRNVSYGLLAAIMIINTVLIGMRHKVNPQTVVTAQAAIPRIVLAAILITFSYAIAAFFEQLIGGGLDSPLVRVAQYFVQGATSTPQIPTACQSLQGVGTTVIGNVNCNMNIVDAIFQGITVAISLIIMVVLSFIMMVVFLFVFAFVYISKYLELLLLTIAAPFIFAISAIPGQEHWIIDWFKKMLVIVLTIPVMVFLLSLGFQLYFYITTAGTGSWIPGIISSSLAPFVGLMLTFAVWIMAIKAPGMVSSAIMGPPRKR